MSRCISLAASQMGLPLAIHSGSGMQKHEQWYSRDTDWGLFCLSKTTSVL